MSGIMDEQAIDLLLEMPMAVGIFKGPDYIVQNVNNNALNLFGKSCKEIIDKPIAAIFPELVDSKLSEILTKVYITGERYAANEQEITFARNNIETTLIVNFSISAVKNSNGQIDGAVLSVLDVSELISTRKKAEDAIEAVKIQYATLEAQSNAIPDGLVIVDTKGAILSYNKKFGTVWKMPDYILNTKDDVAALDFAKNQVVDASNFESRVSEIYQNGKEKCYDELLLKDGRILERYGVPINGDDGENYGWAWYFRDLSDRSSQAQRQRIILESLPQMAWTATPDGKVDYLNARWYQYNQTKPSSGLYQEWISSVHPSQQTDVLDKWNKCVASHQPYENEVLFKRADGEYRWHLARGIPIIENETVLFWVGTCTDIHDFKQLEDSLQLQATILESMDEGVSVSNEDGFILYTNKALDAMFGYDAGELIGKHVTVQNADEENQSSQKVQRVIGEIKEHGFWRGSWFNKRKDGSVFHTHSNITGINSNQKTLFVCVQKDISDERKNQEAMDYQTMLFKTMTDNATSTLFMMDKTGYCTFMNAGGERMFGYTQDEIREKPLHYMIHHHRPDGSFYPMHECPIDRALPENFDVRAHRDLFFRKDGTSFPVTCAASPIFEDGVPVSTVIEVRDISRELEAEQSLLRSATELEELVLERTLELKAANSQLQQFTYAASHDLQEPLRKINFFIDRLQKNINPLLDEKNLEIIQKILTTSNRMKSLINDLLTYSNAALGTTEFDDVDLNVLVEGVLSDLEVTIIEKDAEVEMEKLPSISGDEKQLRQMFHNLLSNALKYQTPERTPKVKIEALILDNNDDQLPPQLKNRANVVAIKVTDNGIGFEQRHAEKIFQIFQRLHGKSEYEGTGVGLSIVSKVAENHGGYVTAESTLGLGSQFTVYLPLM